MKVLITSGGGAKGAFSIGALEMLQQKGITEFDFISGTSTGSLIAAMMAAGRLDVLGEVYRITNNEDILQPQNIIDNFTLSPGKPFLYDDAPLERQIRARLDDANFQKIMQSPVVLCLNAVCLQTGKITVFTTKPANIKQNSAAYDVKPVDALELLIRSLLGSTNQAFFLPPIKLREADTEQYVDGGNREVIPTKVIVNNLNEHEDHEIYVLSNNPHELFQVPDKNFTNIIEVLFRSIVMFIHEGRENDLEALRNFKLKASTNGSTVKIFYIHPLEELDKDFPTGLRFDQTRMKDWIDRGSRMAAHVLTNFPGGNLHLTVNNNRV